MNLENGFSNGAVRISLNKKNYRNNKEASQQKPRSLFVMIYVRRICNTQIEEIGLLSSCKAFLKVCDDIVDVLSTDGKSDCALSDSLICKLLVVKL